MRRPAPQARHQPRLDRRAVEPRQLAVGKPQALDGDRAERLSGGAQLALAPGAVRFRRLLARAARPQLTACRAHEDDARAGGGAAGQRPRRQQGLVVGVSEHGEDAGRAHAERLSRAGDSRS